MPPRRPGGKYKGVIKAHRGEETLLAEAAAAKQRALEEHLARLEAKKDSDLRAADELRRQRALQEEATRLWIVSCWISNEKSDQKKFFNAWLVGMSVYKQEKERAQRAKAWRRSCSCPDGTCGGACGAHLRLRDAHADPLETAAAAGLTLFNGPLRLPPAAAQLDLGSEAPRGFASRRQGSSTDLRAGAGTLSGTAALTLGATLQADGSLRRAWSFGGLGEAGGATVRASGLDAGAELCRSSAWGCRCRQCSGAAKLPNFVNKATATVMIHHKTGRRCLVDPKTMRMSMMDVTRPHVMAGPQSVV